MEKKRILVCDDEPDYLEAVKRILSNEGYTVIAASKGKEALDKIVNSLPDLVILDWKLPDISGIDICKELKNKIETRAIPIILLTVKSTETDIVLGLETGADDYVTKPFSPGVLLARVRTALRRKEYGKEEEKIITSGYIVLNLEKHSCHVKGKEIYLTAKEFDLLAMLIKKEGKVLTRTFLCESIWGYEYFGTTRTVDMTVGRLRKKLADQSDRIETLPNLGYCLREKT